MLSVFFSVLLGLYAKSPKVLMVYIEVPFLCSLYSALNEKQLLCFQEVMFRLSSCEYFVFQGGGGGVVVCALSSLVTLDMSSLYIFYFVRIA